MDLTDLRLEVRERLAETTADFFTDSEVDRAINEAVRRFCAEEQWPFLLTEWSSALVADANTLDLPENVSLRNVFNVALDGGSLSHPIMVERVDANEGFKLRHMYEDHTGTPRWYYISHTDATDNNSSTITYTARFIPTPDAAYTVEAQYMVQPSLLTLASEEPMLPEEYHEAVVAWATGKLFLKEQGGISQKSSEQFGLYAKVLDQARNDLRSFALDEVVAWGRQYPRTGGGTSYDLRVRVPPTLGG